VQLAAYIACNTSSSIETRGSVHLFGQKPASAQAVWTFARAGVGLTCLLILAHCICMLITPNPNLSMPSLVHPIHL
jgi:hypothetical protein